MASDDVEAKKRERSQITGDFEQPAGNRVTFRLFETRRQWIVTLLWSLLTAGLTIGYVTMLIIGFTQLDTTGQGPLAWLFVAVALVALCNEVIRMPLILTLAITSLTARKPVPVRYDGGPDSGPNVVLFVTFVPKSEDIERLRLMLVAAKKIIMTRGRLTVLVLDEGIAGSKGESQVRFLVDVLNSINDGNRIEYFSRLDSRYYNRTGRHKARGRKRGEFEVKTKHGNINAGRSHVLREPGIFGTVDFFMGLDPDHIPLPEFCERMIGPFNDPDVGYVIGPQAYENATSNYVALYAESSQSVFHTLIQSSANLQGAAMLVGTSYAVRASVLEQIGGFQRSITEDLMTTGAILSRRNPQTHKHWRGIYVPDVLAHGEGPDRNGSLIKQQLRWARGAMEFIVGGGFVKSLWGMAGHPAAALHYLMIMPFYFIMGTSWLLSAANIGLQMATGLSGAVVNPAAWFMFYAFVMYASLYLYMRMRRFNVSPFEKFGLGIRGMIMGVVCAPIYAHAMVLTLLRRKPKFDVTPKGSMSTCDTWYTFRLQIGWIVYYVAIIVLGLLTGHLNLINLAWALIPLLVLASPIAMWVAKRDPKEWAEYKIGKKVDTATRKAAKKSEAESAEQELTIHEERF